MKNPNAQNTSLVVRLLVRKEVAVAANVCVHTVALDVKAGLLREIRFNRRRLRYHPDDVATYLAARTGRPSLIMHSISQKPSVILAGRHAENASNDNDAPPKPADETEHGSLSEVKSADFLSKSAKPEAKSAPSSIMKFFIGSLNRAFLRPFLTGPARN